LDDAQTGIVQGTRKLLDSTKSYLLGYATTLSSKVQNRLTDEKSKVAVSKNLIKTAPISLIKRENERQKDRTGRFQTGYRRQINNAQKDLLNLKKRFQPDRFFRRIQQEHECVCDWEQRFRQKFKILIDLRRQQVTQLSRRFRLETIINHIGNEKTKLANKAATLRAEVLPIVKTKNEIF
jgi:exonuclease VII large subunit